MYEFKMGLFDNFKLGGIILFFWNYNMKLEASEILTTGSKVK